MSRRTTILLDEDMYERLAEESLRRYKTTRAISKVVNELLGTALKSEATTLSLILSEKRAKIRVSQRAIKKARVLILDTTYLLPLVRIAADTDLLEAMAMR